MEFDKRQKQIEKIQEKIHKLEQKNRNSSKRGWLREVCDFLRNGRSGANTFLLSVLTFGIGVVLLIPCILGAFPLPLIALSITLMAGGALVGGGPVLYIDVSDKIQRSRAEKIYDLRDKANRLSWEIQGSFQQSNELESEEDLIQNEDFQVEQAKDEVIAKYTTKKELGTSKQIEDNEKDL